MLFQFVLISTLAAPLFAFPSMEMRNNDGTVQGNIVIPPRMSDTSLKVIPDKDHPYRAPGPNDQRGPCPGLNTLANHGYLPRDGIVSFADVVNGVQEGYNMDYDLASGIAAFAMLTRGNVLKDKLSIGSFSNKVKPLPKNLDGIPCGLVGHGKFEGDVSFTRQDAALGDHQHFQADLFAQMLDTQKQYGNGTDIVDAKVLSVVKLNRFNDSLARNPTFEYHEVRETFSYGEAAFTLRFFKNGTEDVLRVPVMTSFYANERFPENWHRQNGSVSIDSIGDASSDVSGDTAPSPGAKAANGTYVKDTFDPNTEKCQLFNDLVENVSSSLFGNDSTPQIMANTNQLIQIIKSLVGQNCTDATPKGTISQCGMPGQQ